MNAKQMTDLLRKRTFKPGYFVDSFISDEAGEEIAAYIESQEHYAELGRAAEAVIATDEWYCKGKYLSGNCQAIREPRDCKYQDYCCLRAEDNAHKYAGEAQS